MKRIAFVLPLWLSAACATTPGIAPLEMGALKHERAAAAEEEHARNSALIDEHLGRCALGSRAPESGAPCWTAGPNSGAEARRVRERQLRLATEHRAAAQALRDAEARDCVGISVADREMSPFLHARDFAGVEPLYGQASSPRGAANRRLEGAAVTFRAVSGLTVEWIQRVVDCHIARNAVLGYDEPSLAACPLGLRGVSTTVRSARGGFAVEMRGDLKVAEQILRRAQALVKPQPGADAPAAQLLNSYDEALSSHQSEVVSARPSMEPE